MKVFVARQAIFDTSKKVFGYELLFRSSLDNFYDSTMDGDHTTAKLIADSFLVLGIDTITRGKRAFINFTRNHILSGAPAAISKDIIAVEVLEDIEPDKQITDACRKLKESGYLIVLDDFVFAEKYACLIDYADIIKIDFVSTTEEERKHVFNRVNNSKIKFLAEKVETAAEFCEALDLGYEYFQGYFFSKPVIVEGSNIPGNKLNYIRMMQEVNKPDVEFGKIEDVLSKDISLTYKLMNFINSAFFGFAVQVKSIKHALRLLGINEIKKWVSILALSEIGREKPHELLMTGLVRAKFCEYVGSMIGQKEKKDEFFMMGLFSIIDALLDKPMGELLTELPIADDIKDSLLGKQNVSNDVYKLAVFYEKGDWRRSDEVISRLSIQPDELPDQYLHAVEWANAVF